MPILSTTTTTQSRLQDDDESKAPSAPLLDLSLSLSLDCDGEVIDPVRLVGSLLDGSLALLPAGFCGSAAATYALQIQCYNIYLSAINLIKITTLY